MKSSAFRSFIEEQLADIPALKVRHMFSGFGIYSGEVFFGIIHQETLYFRANDRTKKRYEDAGTTFFTAPGSKKALKNYYEVPLPVLEHRRKLFEWAKESIDAAYESHPPQ